MKRNTSRRTGSLLAGAAVTSLALLLSGCSFWAPQTAAQPYVPSDGAAADIGRLEYGGVKLRNFLLVNGAKDTPGALVGAVVNEGTEPVTVRIGVFARDAGPQGAPLASTSVTARAGELVKVGAGDGGPALQVPAVPEGPGSVLVMRVDTAQGGATLQLPVLPPTGPYASISPTASPTSSTGPSPTDSSSPRPSQSPSPTGSPSTTG